MGGWVRKPWVRGVALIGVLPVLATGGLTAAVLGWQAYRGWADRRALDSSLAASRADYVAREEAIKSALKEAGFTVHHIYLEDKKYQVRARRGGLEFWGEFRAYTLSANGPGHEVSVFTAAGAGAGEFDGAKGGKLVPHPAWAGDPRTAASRADAQRFADLVWGASPRLANQFAR
jgi:hypothetical protein